MHNIICNTWFETLLNVDHLSLNESKGEFKSIYSIVEEISLHFSMVPNFIFGIKVLHHAIFNCI
jgi:hypothetical protein